ncbi:DinB family protein [Hymenobacter volaticus]|uniref:DinB family protein n=1 Tax=Hymenobacter volaticus TaxID=2932254 RepID=A0ABY4GFH6_9BACT|nr:DinB family protein [Hymenobacter volaticus]UOQ69633.1 DinB family protein [Hymenobacter volaticus]
MTTTEQMVRQFRLLTDWYVSVLDGIRPEDGSHVLSENTNSLEWLAGHLLVMRGRNITRLGKQVEPFRYLDTFVDQTLPPPSVRAFDRNMAYPSLAECTAAWTACSKAFIKALETADEHVLRTQIPLTGPTGGSTVEDLLTSIVLHEAFHIGQMSVIRKGLGYPAMYWFQR